MATRWLHAGFRWQALDDHFRVEFDDNGVARIIDFDALRIDPQGPVTNDGDWWAMQRVMTDLRAPD